ncbi:hypothetical protein EAE96_007674 [Botrytis aclada]|nr:hypothetical protein EAE96_007674 [Botrytis aclada]
MNQASKALMKDSEEQSPACHHQNHHHHEVHNHASTSTSASVVNFASVNNSDPATTGLTTKAIQSKTSKYDHLHRESTGRFSCDRKEDPDAQDHHDHNTSTIASTTSITIRGSSLPQASHKKNNFCACHHHARGQQQCEYHHYENAFIFASTSASSTIRLTTRSDQSSTSEEAIFDPGSQDEQLVGVGSWMEEYDDNYGGNYPHEVNLNDTEEPKEREREG